MADIRDLAHGRVAIVTGAGRGIGRGEALLLAAHGFRVVVNDFGADVHGDSPSSQAAEAVVEEIRGAGGTAIANAEDVSDFDGAGRMIQAAVTEWGHVDVLVNNAGILRDRTIANMSADEWDAVIKVHLRGTFAPLRHAAAHWRDLAKAGHDVDAVIINTSSGSGIYGNPGQGNYGAAKAGIASLTIIASQELARYGIRVNAIAPAAHTRMTDDRPMGDFVRKLTEDDPGAFNPYAAENVAPLVVWLASDAAAAVSGRVFNVMGGIVEVAEPWSHGPRADKGARWDVAGLDDVVPGLLAAARPLEYLKPARTKDGNQAAAVGAEG